MQEKMGIEGFLEWVEMNKGGFFQAHHIMSWFS